MRYSQESRQEAVTIRQRDFFRPWSETGNSIATSQINSIIGSANDNNSTTSKARSEAENNLKSLKEKRDKLKKEMNEAVGYDARRSYESQISKLDKEIKDMESKLTYL